MTVADFFGRVRCGAAEKGRRGQHWLSKTSELPWLPRTNFGAGSGALVLLGLVPHELVGGEGQMLPRAATSRAHANLTFPRSRRPAGSLAATPSARLQQEPWQ